MSALVIASCNGKPSIFIDHMSGKSREPKLRRVHETVELTEEEAALGLDAVRQRWANGALFHAPRKVAA